VVVLVDETVRLDFQLQVGDVSNVINISAAPPLVQSNTSGLGEVMQNQQIVSLPLNGRLFSQLVALTPGAIQRGFADFGEDPAAAGARAPVNATVNGMPWSGNNYLIDGVANNEPLNQFINISPPLEAIQHAQPTGLTRRCRSERFGLKPRLDQSANNRRPFEVADILRAASSITAGPRLRPRSKWSIATSSGAVRPLSADTWTNAPAVINASPTIRAATASVPCNKTSNATIGSKNGWTRSCRFPLHGGEVAPVDSLIWKIRACLAEPAS
jgi:hypothetical protein